MENSNNMKFGKLEKISNLEKFRWTTKRAGESTRIIIFNRVPMKS